jgi:hypothetical protein
MGIRDRPTAPRSPWQNGHAERLIDSIRRESLDHVVVFGESHLRHLLRSYMQYYNDARTHLFLNKDAPIPRGCSGHRTHSADTNSQRIAPSICSDLISDKHSFLRTTLLPFEAKPSPEGASAVISESIGIPPHLSLPPFDFRCQSYLATNKER